MFVLQPGDNIQQSIKFFECHEIAINYVVVKLSDISNFRISKVKNQSNVIKIKITTKVVAQFD
jgi:hypothetical protein